MNECLACLALPDKKIYEEAMADDKKRWRTKRS
jgi:hypothetical protein